MGTPSVLGLLEWDLTVDKDGHRDYTADWLIETDDVNDGPQTVLYNTVDLPAIGSYWSFGNDVDAWAFCWPNWKVTQQHDKGEPSELWIVRQTFTTKPFKRCQDDSIEDPLLMPPKLGGSFTKTTEVGLVDKDGNAIRSSSWELFTGKSNEWDNSRPNVSIGLNLATLPLASYAAMVDTVNDATLWGLGARKVKLSNVSWSREVYGTCNYYYTVTYEFDINYNTFDRKLIDSGTMVLSAGGNAANPKDFEVYKDRNGAHTRVFLNGAGEQVADGDDPFVYLVQKYAESNLLLLGIPSSL